MRPEETRIVDVWVPGGPVTVMEGLRIAMHTAGLISTHDGDVECVGGGNGPGGGNCVSIPGSTSGSSDAGVIDFSVLTPAFSCTVSSVHANESTVVAEPGGR